MTHSKFKETNLEIPKGRKEVGGRKKKKREGKGSSRGRGRTGGREGLN